MTFEPAKIPKVALGYSDRGEGVCWGTSFREGSQLSYLRDSRGSEDRAVLFSPVGAFEDVL